MITPGLSMKMDFEIVRISELDVMLLAIISVSLIYYLLQISQKVTLSTGLLSTFNYIHLLKHVICN
jgi:hypothetical protein